MEDLWKGVPIFRGDRAFALLQSFPNNCSFNLSHKSSCLWHRLTKVGFFFSQDLIWPLLLIPSKHIAKEKKNYAHFRLILAWLQARNSLQWEFDPTGKFLCKGHNDCIVVLLESHKGRNTRQTRKRGNEFNDSLGEKELGGSHHPGSFRDWSDRAIMNFTEKNVKTRTNEVA